MMLSLIITQASFFVLLLISSAFPAQWCGGLGWDYYGRCVNEEPPPSGFSTWHEYEKFDQLRQRQEAEEAQQREHERQMEQLKRQRELEEERQRLAVLNQQEEGKQAYQQQNYNPRPATQKPSEPFIVYVLAALVVLGVFSFFIYLMWPLFVFCLVLWLVGGVFLLFVKFGLLAFPFGIAAVLVIWWMIRSRSPSVGRHYSYSGGSDNTADSASDTEKAEWAWRDKEVIIGQKNVYEKGLFSNTKVGSVQENSWSPGKTIYKEGFLSSEKAGRVETTIWGTPKSIVDNDGNKVGDIKTTWTGRSIIVDEEGNEIGEYKDD